MSQAVSKLMPAAANSEDWMTLHQEILEKLAELDVDDRTLDLVMTSLEGEEAVEQVLAGGSIDHSTGEMGGTSTDTGSVYLQDLAVSGFRGIGPEVKMEFPPGPGLTVIVGRNGSGKSSFAEALEVVLTGNALRWEDRSGPWKEGWRNLHDGQSPSISARFMVEGKAGPTTVATTWTAESTLEDGTSTAQHHGEKRTDLAGIGWDSPLDLYRPLLSYNELGMIGARPSELFDTLTAVLGLEPVDAALKTLATVRLVRERFDKQVKKELKQSILPALADLDDERAERARSLLRKRVWDLDALVRLGTASDPGRDALAKLVSLRAPDEDRVLEIAAELEKALSEVAAMQGTGAEEAERLVRLLTMALEHHHGHEGGSCPVCGVGVLDTEWRASTERQVEQLRDRASRYRSADRRLQRAMDGARSLVAVPAIPASSSVDTTATRELWKRWAELPDQPDDMPDHLLGLHGPLVREVAGVAECAERDYSRQEEQWAAIFPALTAWEQKARSAVESRETVKQIRRAEQVVKDISVSLRAARWEPIEGKALRLWEQLRLGSNVNLRSVELAGTRTRRHVDLTVEVDGTEAQALAVASQGEISCLALSLFFPRATLAANPFRFLVIDDPIQAMDPARVDGLARVFAEVAADRQVIVFTHDDRLPESLRRLRIEHTCRQVTRRPGSLVNVSEKRDPVIQYFADARAVTWDTDLPDEVARRVVPGICRDGLEAACVVAVRRRRLGRGESHAGVDDLLERARTLKQKASLALFDDPGRTGSAVSSRITGKWEPRHADAFWDANRGAHKPFHGSLRGLINDCQGLAERLRQL